jgi:hypothetical protein
MSFAELEREWLRRKRGRRKERSIAAVVVVVLLGLAAWITKQVGLW